MKKNNKIIWIVAIILGVIILNNYNPNLFGVSSSNKDLVNEKFDEALAQKISTTNIFSLFSTAGQEEKIRVIITTKDNQELIDEKNIAPDVRLDELNIVAGEYTIKELNTISASDEVIKIYEDIVMKAVMDKSIDVIHAEPNGDYTQNNFGKGVKVCILDTGIDDSHAYIGRLPEQNKRDFTGGGSYADVYGHGTHVAGTVMGSKKRNNTIILDTILEDGMAPDVDLYVGKVLGDDGWGYFSWILEGIDWCVNEKDVDIISMSLSGGSFSGNCDSVNSICGPINSYNKTIIVVAAGNDGNSGGGLPACCSGTVSVAAAEREGNSIAYFSSKNSEVDIAAVGVNVLSTLPGNSFERWSGTSMATPHIAGAFAILKSIKPEASKTELLNAVYSSARNLDAEPQDKQGRGLIDVFKACNILLNIDTTNLNCANIQYGKISESNGRLSLGTNQAWIRVPYFEEEEVTIYPVEEWCPKLNKTDCTKYNDCRWTTISHNSSCKVSRNTANKILIKNINLNVKNYFYLSTSKRGDLSIDNTYIKLGNIGSYSIYLKDNQIYIPYKTNYYYLFKRVDNLSISSSTRISIEKRIKTDVINSKYKIAGILKNNESIKIEDTRCIDLFKSGYSTNKCGWNLK